MPKTIKESDIEKYLIKLCKKNDYFTTKFTSPGLNGVPDRLVITPNQTLFIELKKPKMATRALQDAVIRQMRRSGAIVYRADTKYKLEEIIGYLKQNKIPDYKKENKLMYMPIQKEPIIRDFFDFLEKEGVKNPHLRIFYDNKMLETHPDKKTNDIRLSLTLTEDVDLFDYIEYGNSETITFDFEKEKNQTGKPIDEDLYLLYNANTKFQENLKKFFKKYRLEPVTEYTWSFSLYPIE